ncbi:MAG: hypothetical protein PSX81_08415 [bacterium]|nr:hypothetical protein [bacterium]
MKEYLQLFRGSAFNGAFAVYKRTLVSNVLMNLLIYSISGAILIPLLLSGLGWELADLLNFQEKIKETFSAITPGSNPMEIFLQLFGSVNYAYIFLAALVAIIISAYKNVALYKLNDNEVRDANRNMLDALKDGFSEKVISMIGLTFVLGLLMVVVILGYGLIVYLLYSMAVFAGILFGFILFFFVAIFIIRFSFASPALVHGNMGVFEAINYSFRNITWKRAGLLFLLGVVVVIISMILGMIVALLIKLTGIDSPTAGMPQMIANQAIQNVINSLIGAFFFASFTAIYFRYSDDSDGEEKSLEEHFISN